MTGAWRPARTDHCCGHILVYLSSRNSGNEGEPAQALLAQNALVFPEIPVCTSCSVAADCCRTLLVPQPLPENTHGLPSSGHATSTRPIEFYGFEMQGR
jgi:hypothetical protein